MDDLLVDWSVPVDGSKWPNKSIAISAWMSLGIQSWARMNALHRGIGAVNSEEYLDSRTLYPAIELGEIQNAVQNFFGCATDAFRSIAALYFVHNSFPLTRGHQILMRSLQEECGRIVWLLEPGEVFESETLDGTNRMATRLTPKDIDFGMQRAQRFRQLYSESLHNRWQRAAANSDSEEQAKVEELQKNLADDQRENPDLHADKFPKPTEYAEHCERFASKFHLQEPKLTRSIYNHLSSVAHGGLLPASIAIEASEQNVSTFSSDPDDHDTIAALCGRWWLASLTLVCFYMDWDWKSTFEPFLEVGRALFPNLAPTPEI